MNVDDAQPVRSLASDAWIEEAERRMDLVRAGKMRLIDADEILADPDEAI